MSDTSEPPPEAWAWFNKRVAELTGIPLLANGELDDDAINAAGEEKAYGALAVIQAEAAVHGIRRLVDEGLEDEITDILRGLPEDHAIWRLLNGTMSDEEHDAITREKYGSMSEEELFDTLRTLVPEDRIRVRRLLGMDDDE
jgi:hypothetical protein